MYTILYTWVMRYVIEFLRCDRWSVLGLDQVLEAPAEDAELRRKQRLEAMRLRQQQMMQRMQRRQQEAVQGFQQEEEEEEEELMRCAMCREVGSVEDPLAMLAEVGDFQGKSSFKGGQRGGTRP